MAMGEGKIKEIQGLGMETPVSNYGVDLKDQDRLVVAQKLLEFLVTDMDMLGVDYITLVEEINSGRLSPK